MFGFIDESGELKRVSYSANNKTGFQSVGTLAPGEEKTETATKAPPTPPLLYQQIIRPLHGVSTDNQATTRRPLFRPSLARDSLTTTTNKPLDPSSRKPVLLYAQSIAPATASDAIETSTRPTVIQTIPRSRRPHEILSSTERPIGLTTRRPLQLYGQYIRQHPGVPGGQPIKQIYVTPAPVEEASEHPEASTVRTSGIIYGHYVNPTQSPDVTTVPGQLLRRVVLARRPAAVTESTESTALHAKQIEEKKEKEDDKKGLKGNNLRRQLSQQDRNSQAIRIRQSGTDDTGDVYGGSIGGSPRPIPATPFRSLFAPPQPRAAQSAVLQSQLLQGIPTPRPVPPGYPQDDLATRVPPGAVPSGVGGSIRIPLGVLRGGVLDPRVPPGSFQYTPPQGYQYLPPQGANPDLQEQLLQLLLGRQAPRQPVYDYPYRQQTPVQQLTPFQLALMMTLGENIPPELLDDPYQPLNRQQPAYNPQQVPYNRQVPYPVAYNPQLPYTPQAPYPAQQPGYPPVQPGGPYGQQTPYNPSLPYPQQGPEYTPQQYPQYYPGQLPYQGQLPYYIRRRLRYRPQPVYNQGLPFPNGQAVPPDFYQQQIPYPGRNGVVGYPQELLPDEYRDALLLRMLLAVRAAQQGRPQHRPIEQNPNIQERSQPYFATDSSTTSTTTLRPRTLAPVRNVQILDPITEETQAKRSTEKPPSRS
ncbi:hypothetical protein L9F63_005567 [Diploptera punctata]|uniref:Uncharacterized protein n=1 Tax=Diploptera punctata TaxID=6984 RepID=A0AAD7ZCT2_DIPPU|nr:hypothetical protein L9F63_005567 [Diploptera punctata]